MYEQLYRYFAAAIRAGRLRPGERLPSKRALCAHLGVSRSTVETAYGLLAAEGYIRSRPKSGYFVWDFVRLEPDGTERRDGAAAFPGPRPVPAPGPDSGGAGQGPRPLKTGARPAFDFSTASVDTSRFPYSSWARLNKEVVYSSPELLQRGERQGDRALRESLAAFLAQYRGVSCRPEQIVVGAGMEYLTGLLLQLFAPETVFALEDPGYGAVGHAMENLGRRTCYIPLDENGMQVQALEDSGAQVAYITPSHQFPMGVTMPAGRRSQLLHWAADRDRYIVEDDYDSEFRYGTRPVPAMQGMDTRGRVIYTGTFSRSLAPSIRIAYLVLPPALLDRYRALRGHSLSTVSRYEQAVMARFLDQGLYARYLRRVGNLYRQRRAALLEALAAIRGTEISGSSGGTHFLLTNRRFSQEELLARAAEAGIRLQGLSGYCRFCVPRPSTLVIGYGGLEDSRIPEAMARLARAWG